MENFTPIPNELFQSDFWRESKLSHQAAFIDLFRMRRNSPSVIEVRGHGVTIEIDQAFVGLRKLSERWGVSKDTASRYLKIFEKTRLIKTEKSRLGTRITFLCFTRSVLKSRTPIGTQTGTPVRTIQDVNKMNKMNAFKKLQSGHYRGYCSKCGRDHFLDKWQIKKNSSSCHSVEYSPVQIKMIPKKERNGSIQNHLNND